MLSALARRFAALPTAAKLFLILTAALLPIGLGLVWVAQQGIGAANGALEERSNEQARAAAGAIESLIARNALAIRIAANGALIEDAGDPCAVARRSLAIVPAVAQHFELDNEDGTPLCTVGDIGAIGEMPLVAPGAIGMRIAPARDALIVRVGVINGMASVSIPLTELRDAAVAATSGIVRLSLRDDSGEVQIHNRGRAMAGHMRASVTQWPIGNERLSVEAEGRVPTITNIDRLLLLLPLLMWVMAALVTWLLVSRVLIRPLKRLEQAVARLEPGDNADVLPTGLGPATEIRELRDALARGITRVEESEHEMAVALEGQRKLVREVHHRVKNNLQVVASLLNIHGRTATAIEARAAYAAIGRRVGALSIVQRNHFAEMEENRGISLRPLLAELTAELRAGAPEAARALSIELDLESAYTTQDAAVSVAFLVTEIVEYAMLHLPKEVVEISLRRSSELTARLCLGSPVLVPDDSGKAEKAQFERIIAGLAKQLRSNLDRKLGRYSVELPVFPAN